MGMQPKMTPLMQQFWEVKSQHPDKIILFRMGDFFEMFHEDAEKAAPIIGLALTQRNKKDADSPKMCGVPHHSVATPIAKLLQAGLKVAICDQIEDPALAKGLVKRAVTRVLTPGMVYDPDTLDQLSAHFLCSYDQNHLAFVDVTTGEAFYYAFMKESDREEIIALLSPAEIVLEEAELRRREIGPDLGRAVLSLFGGDFNSEVPCIDRLKGYIAKLQGKEVVETLPPFELRQRKSHLRLSVTVLRHLEVFANARGEKQGSLFTAIQRTQTSSGARLLKTWLAAPLLDLNEISRRHDEIEGWMANTGSLKNFRQQLSRLGDLERRLGKVHSTVFNSRDLLAIAQSVLVGESLVQLHPRKESLPGLKTVVALAQDIERTLVEDPPYSLKEGGLIRQGVVPELDEWIVLTQDAQKLLLELESREKEATGIPSLKVRYNNVFGFYIELTKTHAHKAPDHYRRKQTLANAERYTTDELQTLEEKILSARTRRDQMEFEVFSRLKARVIEQSAELLQAARLWARWDVLSSLAWLALERRYVRPSFNSEGVLNVELSRHPVVEQGLKGGFVANSLKLSGGDCMLLTGPNMAGKSTFMRQVALLSILAQAGSFVPAEKAELPVFEQIFTRIGASDFLSEGLSTFMVEMSETSEILKQVTPRSLVVMDEIGRGTSTYDGLSLAQAILEYLVAQKKPFLLFATHYHELTTLDQAYPQIFNAHMAVQDSGTAGIQFLHSLKAGPANRSYGIHVAELAGLPGSVTKRAQKILSGFEKPKGGVKVEAPSPQLSFGDFQQAIAAPPWVDEVKNLDLSSMTPLEALNKLSQWQSETV